jgi:subtilisin
MVRSTPRVAARRSTTPSSKPTSRASGNFTGRYLVLLRDNGVKEGLQAVKNATGLGQVCNSADFASSAVEMTQANQSEVFVLDKLKVAVVDADPTQAIGLRSAAGEEEAILAVEPEQIMYALNARNDSASGPVPLEYLRGYKDAINQLYNSLVGAPENVGTALANSNFTDNPQFTWGLQATRTHQSRFTGKGIRVAVLDTGFDLSHPDFVGRNVVSQSFIQGEAVDDQNGHGTHCVGTALGAEQPANGSRRYGCAPHAELYVGKVLSNQGSGGDAGILAGINWAIANQCRVISMSLGAPVQPGEPFSRIYENVARRALQADPGMIIVAAAGNESRDPQTGARRRPPNPVGRPANCPSILAVAAVDTTMAVAPFSNGGINPEGGGVDIAGPGVAIFSTAPDPAATPQPPRFVQWPARYHTISGTSMATPHVAGIAAMWLEARGSSTSAQALWQLLTGNALRLALSSQDVGAGLVQAP